MVARKASSRSRGSLLGEAALKQIGGIAFARSSNLLSSSSSVWIRRQLEVKFPFSFSSAGNKFSA